MARQPTMCVLCIASIHVLYSDRKSIYWPTRKFRCGRCLPKIDRGLSIYIYGIWSYWFFPFCVLFRFSFFCHSGNLGIEFLDITYVVIELSPAHRIDDMNRQHQIVLFLNFCRMVKFKCVWTKISNSFWLSLALILLNGTGGSRKKSNHRPRP